MKHKKYTAQQLHVLRLYNPWNIFIPQHTRNKKTEQQCCCISQAYGNLYHLVLFSIHVHSNRLFLYLHNTALSL